jgi:hypothetical protein
MFRTDFHLFSLLITISPLLDIYVSPSRCCVVATIGKHGITTRSILGRLYASVRTCKVAANENYILLLWHEILTLLMHLNSIEKVSRCKLHLTTQNYWISEPCPSSGILNTRKYNVSETGSVSVLRRREGNIYCWVL